MNSRTSQPPKDARGKESRWRVFLLALCNPESPQLADNRHSSKTHQQNQKRGQKAPQQQEVRKANQKDHKKTELRAMTALVWAETRREKAGGQQQQEGEGAREGSNGQEERKQHGPRRWAHAALTVAREGSGSPLSAGKKSIRSTPATWCRGQSLTQGRSLCCHEERWRQEPSRHNTPYQIGPSQDTTRYPEGGTNRKVTGPEGPKGPTEGRAGQGGRC